MNATKSHGVALAQHEARILRADPSVLAIMIAMPLVVMAFVADTFAPALQQAGYADANGSEQAVPGMAVMFSYFMVAFVGFAVFRDHGWGTWRRIVAATKSKPNLLFGKMAVPFFASLVQMTVVLAIGSLLYDVRYSGQVAMVLPIVVGQCLVVAGAGLLIASMCSTVSQVNALGNVAGLVLGGLGGAFTPSEFMPAWARTISPATPSYWSMRGFRAAILGDGGWNHILTSSLVLVAFAVVLAFLGYRRFNLSDQKVFSFG